MHHFVTEMCTFLLHNGALWDMVLVHHGICETCLTHWAWTRCETFCKCPSNHPVVYDWATEMGWDASDWLMQWGPNSDQFCGYDWSDVGCHQTMFASPWTEAQSCNKYSDANISWRINNEISRGQLILRHSAPSATDYNPYMEVSWWNSLPYMVFLS